MQAKRKIRRSTLTLVAILAGVSLTSHAGGLAVVQNNNDSGPGSLRDALEEQQANWVVIPRNVGDINIDTTLEYSGRRSLKIVGSGQTIATSNNVTLLAITEGANLTVKNLDFQGPGGFNILNRGDQPGPAGKGIFVDVRDDQTGIVKAAFKNVSVSGVANHGIHISDCSLADDCGGGSGGGGEGSPASIHMTCIGCKLDDAGNGKFDADGVRVDERGDGGIYAMLKHSSFTNAGADGVEADEGNDGDVRLWVLNTDLSDNGGYCDPEILAEGVPDDAEFEESEMVTEVELPDTPDNACIEVEIERYDSGFIASVEYGIDTDDGIDGDEAGDGSLWISMLGSTIDYNLDEGVDMDEEDDGHIVARYLHTSAMYNTDDGFKMTEEGDGNLDGRVRASLSADNGGKGFVFEEEKDGDLRVSVKDTTTSNNDDGDGTGIEAVQEEPGIGTLKVRRSDIADGIDLDGVDEI